MFFLPFGLFVSLYGADIADAQNPAVGQAQYAIGSLLVLRPDGIEDRLRGRGAVNLFEHDILRTAQGDRGLIELGDAARIGINENTTLQVLSRWEKNSGTSRILRLKKGQLWLKVAPGGKPIEVETASGTAIVANAEIDIQITDDGESVLSVAQGTVPFATAFGWCTVTAVTMSSGALGRGCSPITKINPQQFAAWSRDLAR
jgi:ferric-dicitrate binding protein FerR (iron transport regulator)